MNGLRAVTVALPLIPPALPCRSGAARKADDEAGAEARRLAVLVGRAEPVLGPDRAPVGLDDLARDRQAEARILAEALLRAGRCRSARRSGRGRAARCRGRRPRRVISISAVRRRRVTLHRAVRRREGAGIVDEVVEDLAEAAVVAERPGRRRGPCACRSMAERDRAARRPGGARWRRTTTASRSRAMSTGSASARASSASRREASEMSLISRSRRRTSCWMIDISRCRESSLRASGRVSTALRREVSGFFSSCATSAAKLSMASMRL